ncbi:MAG: hypothetical protein ACFFCX_16220 [Candidatus Sifarchaeia archaeon]
MFLIDGQPCVSVFEMTYAFIVFYRFQMMTPEQAGKAKEFWQKFSKEDWPEHLKIIGDYKYAWGSDWSGFLFLETDVPQIFFEFWPIFRNKTRWYIENTRTIISVKRAAEGWM